MPYWDLNIPWTSSTNTKEMVETAISLGYDGIAFNHIADKLTAKDTCPIKKVAIISPTDAVPAGNQSYIRVNSKSSQQGLLRTATTIFGESSFQQLTRITLTMTDQAQQHSLSPTNPILKGYDIVAVNPTTDKALHACIQSDNIDIISLDMSSRLPYYLKLTPVKMALERGVMFEVSYAPGLKDSTSRRQLITNCLHLFFLTRGKNIIFTSGALKALDLRSPADVLNMAILFGLQGNQLHTLINTNPYSIIKHAETRKTTKAVIKFVDEGKKTGDDNKKNENNNKRSGDNLPNNNNKKQKV